MTRNPRKENYTRSRFRKFRNKFCKNPTKESKKTV